MKIDTIPLAKIHISETEFQKSRRQNRDQAALEDLAQSIRNNGLINPITVSPRDDGDYQLIAGEGRYLATHRLDDHDDIACVIKDISPAKALRIQLIENLQRENPDPMTEALGFAELNRTHGIKINDIAQLLGVSRSLVNQRLALTDLEPDQRSALTTGVLTVKGAVALARSETTSADRTEIIDTLAQNPDWSTSTKNAYIGQAIHQTDLAKTWQARIDSSELTSMMGDYEILTWTQSRDIFLPGTQHTQFDSEWRLGRNEIDAALTKLYQLPSGTTWLMIATELGTTIKIAAAGDQSPVLIVRRTEVTDALTARKKAELEGPPRNPNDHVDSDLVLKYDLPAKCTWAELIDERNLDISTAKAIHRHEIIAALEAETESQPAADTPPLPTITEVMETISQSDLLCLRWLVTYVLPHIVPAAYRAHVATIKTDSDLFRLLTRIHFEGLHQSSQAEDHQLLTETLKTL